MTWTDRLRRRRLAYRRLFLMQDGTLKPDAALVLADLRRFCHHDRSTLKVSPVTRTVDALATLMAEGRREVFVRLLNLVEFDERQVPRQTEDEE